MLRAHGTRDRRTYEIIGFNSRLDEIQAALLRIIARGARWLDGRPPRGGG